MGKNLIPAIADMLGVKIGEKFMLRRMEHPFEENIFWFEEDGLRCEYEGMEIYANAQLHMLLSGKIEVKKFYEGSKCCCCGYKTKEKLKKCPVCKGLMLYNGRCYI